MSRILLVDDSPTVLHITGAALAKRGCEILTAADGEEALQLSRQEQPNLVLLDVILPKFNGYEVCRQLKSTPETTHIPVVMLTSKTKDTDRQWGMKQGADDYITKPFDADDLLRVVGRFLPQIGSDVGL